MRAVYNDWFLLAGHLGLPLSECMKRHTHREFLAWTDWLRDQWNQPSRSDHYLMQIAAEIRGVFSKKRPKISDFKFSFTVPEKTSPQTRAAQTRMAIAHWMNRVMPKGKK